MPPPASGLAAAGLVVAATLAGCGAGQISQVATQEPAVNGTLGNLGPVALRSVTSRPSRPVRRLEPGSDVAPDPSRSANSSRTSRPAGRHHHRRRRGDADRQYRCRPGDARGGRSRTVAAGAGRSVEAATAAGASVALTKPIRNGLTYDFTFTFEKAGQKTR